MPGGDRLLLARPDADSPQTRLIRGVHEIFTRTLSGSLSAFLQADIGAALSELSFLEAAEYRGMLSSPGCFLSFQLDPRPETMILSFDPPSVFSLLELLLGGSGATHPEARVLTEIEWSLLEEVVRVLARALGEAWKTFHAVEFNVRSLESDPALLPFPDDGTALARLTFSLRFGETSSFFDIVVPRTLFEKDLPPESTGGGAEHNLALLADAKVDVEVLLDGPTMLFQELAQVHPGQVIGFDFPLRKPVRAVVNGAISIPCVIVSAGGKRAFQVEELPDSSR
jgi:flagellar motor switch protein FliM